MQVQPEVIMAITVGAVIGLVKSAREGIIALTSQTIEEAEEVCWSGISTGEKPLTPSPRNV